MPSLLQNKGKANHRLSERLLAIVDALPKGGVICDIGSDHGILPLHLLRENLCEHCVVTDLNALPLNRARESLCREGVDDRATFLLSDGICDVLQYNPNAIVIAGMGGETIAGILERALDNIPIGTRFVLQPMTKEELLRRFLYEKGFEINEETVVSENKKFFLILSVTYTSLPSPREEDLYFFGEHLFSQKNIVVVNYFKKELQALRVRIAGREGCGGTCETERRVEKKLLSFLEDFNEDS